MASRAKDRAGVETRWAFIAGTGAGRGFLAALTVGRDVVVIGGGMTAVMPAGS